MRLSACFGAAIDVIEPCGFLLSDAKLRRAAMDYGQPADLVRHTSWNAYLHSAQAARGRLVLFTTRGADSLWDFAFHPDDRLLFGRESAGVPASVHDAAGARVRIPIRPQARSLNVAVSAAIALAEASRQLGALE